MKKVIWVILGLTATILLYQFTSSSNLATTTTNTNDEMVVIEAPDLEDEEVLFPDDIFNL
jgi:hypothetical protein